MRAPLSAMVFATIGAALLILAAALAYLGSFAYLAAAAVGMFFIAATLVSRAVRAPEFRAPAILALAALALVLFGTVATPFYYAGWGLLAGSVAMALIARVDARNRGGG